MKCIHNKQKYFAEFIHTSAKKKSNFERDLLQVVIRRAEVILLKILIKNKYLLYRSICQKLMMNM